jgi:predicted metalloprotease with PDZ domain
MPVRHQVAIADAQAHLATVTSTFAAPEGGTLPDPLEVAMPVWTPGSYLVREYARCIEAPRALGPSGEPLRIEKLRKNAWAIHHGGAAEVTFAYELYCNELSVRTNHLDDGHLILNGAATFCFASHAKDQDAEVSVAVPEGWSIAAALPREGEVFRAADYDELVDTPFHAGRLDERAFEVCGKRHRFLIDGAAKGADWETVVRDTSRIIETEARLMGGLPYEEFLFHWILTPRNRGGLEHANSTLLTVPPSAFDDRRSYLDVLSLVAHEFLHLWNVKRMRPAGLTPYRYEEENYTRLLWWFEGATSYFDWRVLRLAGLCTVEEYLEHLAEEIGRLEDTPGRRLQSASESSFDAWIKLYRADENTVNSTVSYYLKGEIVCALLDLEMRARTKGTRSLDDVLVEMWRQFGLEGRPVPEDAMPAIFERVAGGPMHDVLEPWVDGRDELPVDRILAKAGLRVVRDAGRRRGVLGVRLRTSDGRAFVSSVLRGRAAHAAGIDAGDEIVAIDGKRVEGGKVDAALAGKAPGAKVELVLARDGLLREARAILEAPVADRLRITLDAGATAAQRTLLEGWLQGMPQARS